MDDKLDAKLEAIVIDPCYEPDGMQLSASDIAKIKQAFIDDGWVKMKVPNHAEGDVVVPIIDGYLSGQEWYDRFEKEIHKPWTDEEIVEPQHSADEQLDFYTAEHVIEAAKKAAGIE